jgi:cell division septation protein DedD
MKMGVEVMMATRRRRRSRRPAQSSNRAATVFLLIVLIGVMIWFAAVGNIGKFIAERIIAPLSGRTPPVTGTSPVTTQSLAPASASPGVTDASAAVRVSGSVEMQGFGVYCVQWGAFSAQENAELAASGCRSRGAAAYIYKDGDLYRVLGDAFLVRDEAAAARDVYTAFYKMDAFVYEMAIPAVSLKVVATQPQIDAMQRAFDIWAETVESLRGLITSYETRQITAETLALRLEEYARDLTHAGEELSSVAGDTSDSPVLSGILSLLSKTGQTLSTMCQQLKSETEGAILTDLKYNYIGMLAEFRQYSDKAVLA